MPETKQKIIQTAESVFMKYGIRSISMDDISHRLGISKKTLYQHFKDKEDLIVHVLSYHKKEEESFMKKFREEAADSIDELFKITTHVMLILQRVNPTTIIDLQKYYREIWQSFEKDQYSNIFKCIISNLESGIRDEIYRQDLDVEIISRLYMSKAMSIVFDDYFQQPDIDKSEVFKQHMMYHLHGIISPKGNSLFHQYNNSLK